MYDLANSAYITTVSAALLPIYFKEGIVGDGGVDILGLTVSATAMWGFMLGFAALLVFLFVPVLGSIADFSSAKKRFLIGFAYFGSAFTSLLFFSRPGDVWYAVILYICTHVCFVGANVFYDAFLPHITTEDKIDAVSAKGYAYGYVGGPLQFGVALAFVALHEKIGKQLAVRIGMAMTGIWWAGWTLSLLGDPMDNHQTCEKSHGRLETRCLKASTSLNEYLEWPGIEQVFRYRWTCKNPNTGEESTKVQYGRTSLTPEEASAERLLELRRGHRSIENKSHWMRDTQLGEDASSVRTGAIPQVMVTLRNAALAVLRFDGVTRIADKIRYYASKPILTVNLLTQCFQN